MRKREREERSSMQVRERGEAIDASERETEE